MKTIPVSPSSYQRVLTLEFRPQTYPIPGNPQEIPSTTSRTTLYIPLELTKRLKGPLCELLPHSHPNIPTPTTPYLELKTAQGSPRRPCRLYGQTRSHPTNFNLIFVFYAIKYPTMLFTASKFIKNGWNHSHLHVLSNILLVSFSRASSFIEILTNVWPVIVSSVFVRFESSFLRYDR